MTETAKASLHPSGPGASGLRRVVWLWAILVVLGLPVLLDAGAIGRAAALHALADGPHPYFVPAHAGLLDLWAPVVAVSACILVLTPGLLIALALDRGREIGPWVMCALAVSVVLVSAVAALEQAMLGVPLRGAAFGWSVAVVGALAGAIAVWRSRRSGGVSWPRGDEHARWTAVSMLMVPLLLVAGLAPEFHWQAFNGDGAHAFETARLLLVQPLPFWPKEAGVIASFPGLTSMLFAFPASWFVRLFGEVEASVRIPMLLYLPALFGALVGLAEGRRVPGLAERAAIWLSIVVFTVAMAFSATYSPYSADIALPATQDTLLMICFLGFVWAFSRAERGWMTWFAVLTYVSLPSGSILMALWLGAVIVLERPRPWRRIRWVAGVLCSCIVATALLPSLLAPLSLPVPGREYGVAGMLRYFAFLQFTDLRRVLYVAIPSGIFPIAALAMVGREDSVSRALSLVSVAYFLFFFVQANISLHHFVPSMLLPVAVSWRIAPAAGLARRLWLTAAFVSGAVALGLALPASMAVPVSGRTVGQSIEDRVGGYDRVAPDQLALSSSLEALFPLDWHPSVPDDAYGGSPLVWNHYESHARSSPGDPVSNVDINYVVQRTGTPAPSGTRLVAERDGAAVFVRSESIWRAHQALRPLTPAGSPWLAVPRSTLFRSVPARGGPHVFDVVAILEHLGVNMSPILARLGVQR